MSAGYHYTPTDPDGVESDDALVCFRLFINYMARRAIRSSTSQGVERNVAQDRTSAFLIRHQGDLDRMLNVLDDLAILPAAIVAQMYQEEIVAATSNGSTNGTSESQRPAARTWAQIASSARRNPEGNIPDAEETNANHGITFGEMPTGRIIGELSSPSDSDDDGDTAIENGNGSYSATDEGSHEA